MFVSSVKALGICGGAAKQGGQVEHRTPPERVECRQKMRAIEVGSSARALHWGCCGWRDLASSDGRSWARAERQSRDGLWPRGHVGESGFAVRCNRGVRHRGRGWVEGGGFAPQKSVCGRRLPVGRSGVCGGEFTGWLWCWGWGRHNKSLEPTA